MPKPSKTEQSYQKKPSALEMFTDRVSERELLARLMAPHAKEAVMVDHDFLTVFYGVGGVGKSTLCRKVVASSAVDYPEVMLVVLNLDFGKWTRDSGFAPFLVALVEQFLAVGISTPLVQTLLLMYSRADSGLQVSQGSAGLWSGAVAVLDQATQAVGIPGIGLVIQGAQWLKDRKKQADVAKRLRDLGLWPDDNEGKADLLDMEEKMAGALYEDLKAWAAEGRNLRILLDGFERIQSRERRRDCQMLVQRFAGFIAASEDPELASRIRMLVFGRDKLRWDELYEDPGWNDYWSQHLLAGLGETDAIEFLNKHSDWLSFHGDTVAAAAIQNHTKQILDAADEQIGGERSIYPYYLDLSVDLVLQSAREGRTPDLGKTPGELQERFFRYLDPAERHLLKLLALAETFDAVMFDALVRDQRVSGYAVGTFLTTVAEGRSYVSAGDHGCFRFHRLMEEALQDEWMKSDADRQQGRDAVLWLLDHLEFRIGGRDRKEWGETEIDCWRRGMEIMVSQGYEGDLMPIEECEEIIDKEPWVNEFPISINLQELFLRRRIGALEIRLGLAHSFSQSVAAQLGIILRDKGEYEEAASVLNSAHRAIEETLGSSHPRTLMIATLLATHYRYQGNFAAAEKTLKKTIESQESDPNGTPVAHYGLSILSAILMEIGEVEEAESFRRRNLQVCEKSLGADHPITLRVTKDLGNLLIHLDDLEGAETMLRRALEGYEKLLGVEHVDTLSSLEALGKLMQHRCDFEDAETLLLRAIEGYEKAFGPNHPNTLSCIKNLGELMHEKGDYKSAEKLLRRAHQDMAKALGSDYPATLWFATALGDLLSDKGDHEEAETLYRRVLEIREQKLGLDAPETISSTSHLAVFYWTRSEFSSAENLFRREIESNGRVFGEEGIHTLTSALNLGNLLKEMGNYEEAEELLHRAMEGRKKILGAEHPDTLYSVHCLGDLLVEKGSSVGAEILYRRALAGREKALGSQHPDTLQTVHNLGVAMNLQGYRREAIELLRGYALLSDAAEDALAYNLACYECLEGNHEEAKRLIAKHLTIQPEQKLQALADDDLAAIRDFIQTL